MQKPKTMTVIKMKDLVTYLFDDIKTLYYMIDSETTEEKVVVVFKPRSTAWNRFHGNDLEICVTADSNEALVKDVLKTLWLNL